MKDWLGDSEQFLVDLCEKWEEILKGKDLVAEYGWDNDEVNAVLSAIRAFLTARAAYRAVDTTDNRNAKNDVMKAVKSAMRDFANTQVRFNKKMSVTAKRKLGLRVRDSAPANHPPPESQSDTVVKSTVNHFEHRLSAVQRGTHSRKKPNDAYGVEYAVQIGGTRPASGADIPKTEFNRGTSFTVVHSEADKGKPVYYATRYVNGKGEGGPWSPVVEAYIG